MKYSIIYSTHECKKFKVDSCKKIFRKTRNIKITGESQTRNSDGAMLQFAWIKK